MAMKTVTCTGNDGIPQWKKDLIARLKNQNKTVEERLWIDHHSPNHHSLQAHHHHIAYPLSPDNGFSKDHQESTDSSDSEDLHYGPGIVNRLRNKYLSLALRESNVRPTILRKATSLENLLDEDDGEEHEKEDGRLFRRRGGGNNGDSHQNRFRSSSRRQEMKRARSVEAISRTNHDEEEVTVTSTVTAKINNRQSLHEEMLVSNNVDKTGPLIENIKSYKKNFSIENGMTDDTSHKYNGRINRPKRIPPLLNEREKPPVDVVKQTKLIFERRSDQRSKKHPPTGDVAAKVDSFNNIIVKAKTASKATKLPAKHPKPVLNDKTNSNTQHHARPVAKPVIFSEEIVKPKTLDLKKGRKEPPSTMPSPIPDVSRVDTGNENRNSLNSLCETPDLILTSSPLPKITSPTYRIRSTEHFINEERNSSFLSPTETTNKFVSPILSPTKMYLKPATLNFNKEEVDLPGIKMISPISQKNINKQSATSVFNFINSHVDQKHLPPVVNKNASEHNIPPSEPLKIEVNGFNGTTKRKPGLSAFEIEKNHKNAVKSGLESDAKTEEVNKVKSPTVDEAEDGEQNAVSSGVFSGKPTEDSDSIACTDGLLSQNPDFLGDHRETPEKSWQVLGKTGNTVEKISDIFENLGKNNKPSIDTVNDCVSVPSQNLIEIPNAHHVKPHSKAVAKVDEKTAKPAVKTINKIETIDRSSLKTVQSKSASEKSGSEENAKIIFPKKPKARVEETTTAVFNFTNTRRDVPDYIANDTSKVPSRPVIPKPDEPGIKLLPEALRVNFKEIQEALEEQELIRSLEARPPSPCNVTFINDNILIDGKSSLVQQTTKKVKLKISFVDDADIYEYPSETSLLLEDSPLPSTLGGSTVGGQTVPALSGSSLATYIPKSIEDFELGITKTFYEQPVPASKPDVAEVPEPPSNVILEEVDKPVHFSTGGTSDMLF